MLVKRVNTKPEFLNDFFGRDFFDFSDTDKHVNKSSNLPSVNISENDDEYSLEVSIPGIDKEQIKLEIENDLLTISYDDEKQGTEKSYTRKEFGYESFKRSFKLPENEVNKDKVKASYGKGVLFITLPKREEVKPQPKRLIKIG
ncbi:MAG: Hsp20/alpha crystallin family protein [Cyclobacteriaceae bacterium]